MKVFTTESMITKAGQDGVLDVIIRDVAVLENEVQQFGPVTISGRGSRAHRELVFRIHDREDSSMKEVTFGMGSDTPSRLTELFYEHDLIFPYTLDQIMEQLNSAQNCKSEPDNN